MDDQLPIGFHQVPNVYFCQLNQFNEACNSQLQTETFQVEQLRSLWDRNGDQLVDNFRPTQPLNNRTVQYIEQWP